MEVYINCCVCALQFGVGIHGEDHEDYGEVQQDRSSHPLLSAAEVPAPTTGCHHHHGEGEVAGVCVWGGDLNSMFNLVYFCCTFNRDSVKTVLYRGNTKRKLGKKLIKKPEPKSIFDQLLFQRAICKIQFQGKKTVPVHVL